MSSIPQARLAATLIAAFAVAGPALAAPRVGAQSTPAGAALSEQQTVKSTNHRPAFTVLGVPVVIAAPVDAPYNAAAAYSTYAGQPGFGPNAVLANSVGSAP